MSPEHGVKRMAELNFLKSLHGSTKRDYIQRVIEHDKAECAQVAAQWGYDYWDGDRKYGFGGYKYDGRWRPVAEQIVSYYQLKPGDSVLDVGCGKGFLLYEITQVVPDISVSGVDISKYGIENSKEEIRSQLHNGNCVNLPYEDKVFDFVYSINTFHNLKIFEVTKAISELNRVGKGRSYICVESYRNEREKMNLLYWQLTCKSFYDTEEWLWLFEQNNYHGDIGFIFFE